MEKIHENMCFDVVFVFENIGTCLFTSVFMYFLHLVLTFTPHYIIMVKGLLHKFFLYIHYCRYMHKNYQTIMVTVAVVIAAHTSNNILQYGNILHVQKVQYTVQTISVLFHLKKRKRLVIFCYSLVAGVRKAAI